MNLTIHRGAREIGGSCVELQSGESRIIIDIGLPLKNPDGLDFDFRAHQYESVDQLIAKGILPNVKGLYKNQMPSIAAVLISHPHQDHYGLMQYIHPDIPIYISAGTKSVIELTGFFSGIPFLNENIQIVKPDVSYTVGAFSFSPYLVDHSGFDSMAFLIEVETKRIFYSGDFRIHGRKAKVMEKIIAMPPEKIDYLLLEGTLMGSERKSFKTESDIKTELVDFLKTSSKLKIISCSSQNIDRLVSVFVACVSTQHTFVIDPYTANILDNLKPVGPGIPQFDWNNIRVFFTPNSYTEKLAKSDDLWKYKEAKITLDEIKAHPEKLVLKHNFMNSQIMANHGLLKNAELIYSVWSGYFEKERAFWEKHSVAVHHIHTSGHAFTYDLKRFADALNPKMIIPIHTEHPDNFVSFFNQKVLTIPDEQLTVL